MELMRPIGELVRDDHAINAQFPRLMTSPEHYIPYKYVASGQTGELSQAVEMFLLRLRLLLGHYRTNAQASRSDPTVLSSLSFINGISNLFQEFDSTVSTLLPLHYRLRANSMYAIETSFKGTYIDFKRTDYGLLSKGSVSYSLYRAESINEPNALRISTSSIWRLYGHASSVPMHRACFSSESVAYKHVEENIVVPNEAASLARELPPQHISSAVPHLSPYVWQAARNKTLDWQQSCQPNKHRGHC